MYISRIPEFVIHIANSGLNSKTVVEHFGSCCAVQGGPNKRTPDLFLLQLQQMNTDFNHNNSRILLAKIVTYLFTAIDCDVTVTSHLFCLF